ncbi:hypothetical protein P4O66_001025 [Electrophorus voltai]|uniref:Mitochondria-eating protein n=1 Tax=Electrophorus voltai TaxID=2609070 RepID=A0AAD9DUD9_9TELE|nr:hypothetical protein P4O66_001025 [Electrophorus voltai]
MQTLEPPLDLAFSTDGELYSDTKYRRSYDSEFTAPLVAYHVWPALMEGDTVIVKGEAVTRRGTLWRSRSRSRSPSPVRSRSGSPTRTLPSVRNPSHRSLSTSLASVSEPPRGILFYSASDSLGTRMEKSTLPGSAVWAPDDGNSGMENSHSVPTPKRGRPGSGRGDVPLPTDKRKNSLQFRLGQRGPGQRPCGATETAVLTPHRRNVYPGVVWLERGRPAPRGSLDHCTLSQRGKRERGRVI